MQTQDSAGADQGAEGSLLGLAGIALLVGAVAAILGSGLSDLSSRPPLAWPS